MVTDHCGSEQRGPDGYLAVELQSDWLHTRVYKNECVLTRRHAEWGSVCVCVTLGGMNPLSWCVYVCCLSVLQMSLVEQINGHTRTHPANLSNDTRLLTPASLFQCAA